MTQEPGTTLFAYWDALRAGHPVPERSQIDPRAIGPILGDTFMLDGDRAGTLPYRLAGSRVCALFARELKGDSFLNDFTPPGRAVVTRALADSIAAQTGIGLAITASGAAGRTVDLTLTLLPLVHRGRIGSQWIGTLSGTDLPFWVGRDPIGDLEVAGFALLWPTPEGATAFGTGATIQPRSHAFPSRTSRPALRIIRGGLVS